MIQFSKNFMFFCFLLIFQSIQLFGACEIFELQLTKSDCNASKKFFVKINFRYQDVSNCFTVTGNGINYGSFEYSKLPIIIDGLDGNCLTDYEFVVKDCHNNDCHAAFHLGKVCCEANCEISEPMLDRTSCDSNRKFYAFLNFKYKNTSACFNVFVNNHLSGTYKYAQLPVKLGPFEGDCQTARLFQIVDCDKELCNTKIEMEKVCCETICKISNLKIERSPCDSDQKFYAFLTFNSQNTSDSFYIKVNGTNMGKFKYGSPSYKFGPLKADCRTKYGILIQDHIKLDCKTDTLWGPVCCDTMAEPCKLYELNVERSHCDSNGQFFVHINFQHQSTSSCFKISGNGHQYGEFKYTQLPIKLGPFNGDCKTEYEFVIADCEKPDCKLIKELGKICCDLGTEPCKLYELRYDIVKCKDPHFFTLFLNFNHQNTSDCFRVKINGNPHGTFSYNQLPVRIDSLLADCRTEYKIVIQDCKETPCALEKSIGAVCCDNMNKECKIRDVQLERTECDADNQFYVFLKVSAENTSECFKVRGNGQLYGEFKYANSPIKLGPFKGDCQTNYEFVIIDCLKDECKFEKLLGKVCCDQNCEINNLKVERTPCNSDNTFYAVLNFNYTGTSECFKVLGNGKNYGLFRYSQLPLKIGPLPADCNTPYEFVVFDCHANECKADVELGKVCCDSIDHELFNYEMARTDCDPDSMFKLNIKFQYRHVSDSFHLYINGHPGGTFAYAKLPITTSPLKADCHTIYTIKIVDQKDTSINLTRYLERPCCKPNIEPCKIFEVKASPLNCTGPGQYSLQLDFKYSGVTNKYFEVFDGSGPIGFYPFANLPITIFDFKKSGRTFDFVKICENDNARCCSVIEFRSIECLEPGTSKFNIKNVLINNRSKSILLFSDTEFPKDLEFEFFNMEGKSIEIKVKSLGLYELEFPLDQLSTDLYFIRIKSKEESKVYKFFHLN
ncbi:MAG: T9SS type A sorting domain-containing protein [Saprospiraceae bacterium]|nr:T9SS type A sorting domain-containing protein [Saprospiraceae bacterium]